MTDDGRLNPELKHLLVERLRIPGVSPDSIGDDDPLVGGPLGLDSIDILELMLAVEERYGIKFEDEKAGREAFRSISALAGFVCARRASGDLPGSAPT
jgi:acyl carrier protein